MSIVEEDDAHFRTVEAFDLHIDRESVLIEIVDARSQVPRGDAIFFGVNNQGYLRDGVHRKGHKLLRVFDENKWKQELSIYDAAGLQVVAIEPRHGEITQIVEIKEVSEEPLAIRYFGLQLVGGLNDTPADPRAPLLPNLLTETTIARPFVYIFVQMQTLQTELMQKCAHCGMLGTALLKCPYSETFYASEECQSKHWSEHRKTLDKSLRTISPPTLLTPIVLKSGSLVGKTKDVKPAFLPSNEELREFKPAVIYNLGDGRTHTIEAGLYTDKEWFDLTLAAQELVISKDAKGEEGEEEGEEENKEEFVDVSAETKEMAEMEVVVKKSERDEREVQLIKSR